MRPALPLLACLAALPCAAFGQSYPNMTTQAPGGVPRANSQRLADTLNILDFGAASNGSAALTAACNQATGYTSEIWMPAGVYNFASTVTACGGKNIAIRGAGSNATIISASSSATPISITETNIGQTVVIKGLGFNSVSTSATARAIDVAFPFVTQGPTYANLIVDDITVYSSGYGSPYANSYLGGIRVNGAWQASIDHVSYFGPSASGGAPVGGTSAIELQNAYNTTARKLFAISCDAGALQSAYGEYLDMDGPVVVGCNYGLNITNAVRSDKNSQSGLSYYVRAGELDVILAGANLPVITDAYVSGNHIALGRAAGGSGVILAGANKALIQNNEIEQLASNTTATGVTATGATENALISGNQFNAATAVNLGSSTLYNTVIGNMATAGTTPSYVNAGTNNTLAVSCSGTPSASFAAVFGVVTHC